MVTNHIEALEECMNNTTISIEAKKHITDLYNRLVKQKATRPQSPKTKENQLIRDTLNTNLKNDTDYTMAQILCIARTSGVDAITITPHRVAGIINLEKQAAKVVNSFGETVPVYRKKS